MRRVTARAARAVGTSARRVSSEAPALGRLLGASERAEALDETRVMEFRRRATALARTRVGLMVSYDDVTEQALRRAVRDAFGAERGVRVGRRATARFERLREAMRRVSNGDVGKVWGGGGGGGDALRVTDGGRGGADALATWDEDIEWAARLSKRKLRRVEASLSVAPEDRVARKDAVGVNYDELDAAVYAVMRSPMTMGALKRIFYETRDRLGDGFSPKTVLDFGSGPMPTTLFALRAVFGDGVGASTSASLRDGEVQVTFVDSNPGMMRFARRVAGYAKNIEAEREAAAALESSSAGELDAREADGAESDSKLASLDFTDFEDAKDDQPSVSSPPMRLKTPHPWHESEGIRTSASLRGANRRDGFDVVVSSYALGEIPDESTTRQHQRQVDLTIRQLWDKVAPGGILVVAEPGTPKGSLLVRRARALILEVARRDMEQKARRLGMEPSDEDVEAYVVAPCQHDKACPMKESNREEGFSTWCHFPQRIMRSAYMREIKHGIRAYQDEKFSYVVLRRATRASAREDAARAARRAVEAQKRRPESPTDEEEDEERRDAFYETLARESFESWSRVTRVPRKQKGHVVFEVCDPSGEMRRLTVAKSHARDIGRDGYKLARKLRWGDLWPFHPSGVVLRPGDARARELSARRVDFERLLDLDRDRLERLFTDVTDDDVKDDDDDTDDDDHDDDHLTAIDDDHDRDRAHRRDW